MAKKKTVSYRIPENLEEVAKNIADVASLRREIDQSDLELNQKVDVLKRAYTTDVVMCEMMIEDLVLGIQAFSQKNRDELTQGGSRKIISLPTGSFGWRLNPRSVRIKNVKQAVEAMKKLGLKKLLRIKEEPDKNMMLKYSKLALLIPGVKIVQEEVFQVSPEQIDLVFSVGHGRIKTAKKE